MPPRSILILLVILAGLLMTEYLFRIHPPLFFPGFFWRISPVPFLLHQVYTEKQGTYFQKSLPGTPQIHKPGGINPAKASSILAENFFSSSSFQAEPLYPLRKSAARISLITPSMTGVESFRMGRVANPKRTKSAARSKKSCMPGSRSAASTIPS